MLEIEGAEEINQILEQVEEQIKEIQNTMAELSACRMRLQAKINQPLEETNG